MYGYINFQVLEVMKVETTGKRKNSWLKEIVERVHKEGFGTIRFYKKGCVWLKEMAREN